MKVLFVASGNHGGLSPVIHVQGDALMKAGVDVTYFLIQGKGLKGYLGQILPLRRFYKKNTIDVVHSHYLFSAIVASLAGVKPMIVSLMGSDMNSSKVNSVLILFFSWLFHWRHIVVKSRSMLIQMTHNDRISIIPNGVDVNLFIPMDRYECRNRLGWSVRSKHILFPANPDRPEKDFLLAKASVELLDDQMDIHVFKNVRHEDTVYYYNAADVVLLTSKWEGSPNVIKEAMACGCPIVSVDVGDVRERIDGLEGCYLAERTPEDLAEKLKVAIAFGKRTKGRDAIISSGLTNDVISRKIVDVYNSVVGR